MSNPWKVKRARPSFAPGEPVRLTPEEIKEAGTLAEQARRDLDRRLAMLETIPAGERYARYR